jgi:hypothetical protein
MICTYFNKEGHTEDRCFKKQQDNGITPNYPNSSASAKANVALTCYNTCILTGYFNKDVNYNTFIVDSGAFIHMVHSKSLSSNFQKEDGVVKIGDNSEVESEGTGTFTGYHLDKNGQQFDVTLHDVLLVPTLWVNLFSITKSTSKPNCKLICEDNLITVNSNEQNLHFTKILPHGKGKILATEFFY